jgi:hypothetical protein
MIPVVDDEYNVMDLYGRFCHMEYGGSTPFSTP